MAIWVHTLMGYVKKLQITCYLSVNVMWKVYRADRLLHGFNGYNFENFCRIIWYNLLLKSLQSKTAILDGKESKGKYEEKNQFM